MRVATITPEIVDIDVCYGNFDGHMTRTSWTVDFYENSEENLARFEKKDCHYYKTEEAANIAKQRYEAGDFKISQYGGILIFEEA